ncbi:hypothetical protein KKA33_00630 [Patescibacteria group bacterium]|nr:hypothetical protein [Patescibacteria group bacterium]
MKLKIVFFSLAFIFSIMLIGCDLPPQTDTIQPSQPIGGQRDENGCLGPAGYSWNNEIGACVREWELNESQKKAAALAVEHVGAGYATTIVGVDVARCPGCFSVRLEQGEKRTPYTITLNDWKVTDVPKNDFGCRSTEGNWLPEYNECEYTPRDWCEEAGGTYAECESACRHDPNAEICTLQCVPVCQF